MCCCLVRSFIDTIIDFLHVIPLFKTVDLAVLFSNGKLKSAIVLLALDASFCKVQYFFNCKIFNVIFRDLTFRLSSCIISVFIINPFLYLWVRALGISWKCCSSSHAMSYMLLPYSGYLILLSKHSSAVLAILLFFAFMFFVSILLWVSVFN